jgi:hypothetical protein
MTVPFFFPYNVNYWVSNSILKEQIASFSEVKTIVHLVAFWESATVKVK